MGTPTEGDHCLFRAFSPGGLGVKGVTALIPQPGGFECLGLIHEALDAGHPSVAKFEEDCGFGLDLHAATAAASESC